VSKDPHCTGTSQFMQQFYTKKAADGEIAKIKCHFPSSFEFLFCHPNSLLFPPVSIRSKQFALKQILLLDTGLSQLNALK
jgi:hypothetical protein